MIINALAIAFKMHNSVQLTESEDEEARRIITDQRLGKFQTAVSDMFAPVKLASGRTLDLIPEPDSMMECMIIDPAITKLPKLDPELLGAIIEKLQDIQKSQQGISASPKQPDRQTPEDRKRMDALRKLFEQSAEQQSE